MGLAEVLISLRDTHHTIVGRVIVGVGGASWSLRGPQKACCGPSLVNRLPGHAQNRQGNKIDSPTTPVCE
jgi:hypothetical protein